jgi:outer membrane lipoprotein SlyB
VWRSWLLAGIAACSLAACVHIPVGPSVMALPGEGKSFDEFQADDAACRDWAAYATGVSSRRAANDTALAGAAVGTAVGAATGAAIGAASGNPATGAAVGAGTGLLGGTLIGASNAEEARWRVQRRFDMAYMQCMYAKGNQIPVPRGSVPSRSMRAYERPPRPPSAVPPPPRGAPPPPPPGYDDY